MAPILPRNGQNAAVRPRAAIPAQAPQQRAPIQPQAQASRAPAPASQAAPIQPRGIQPAAARAPMSTGIRPAAAAPAPRVAGGVQGYEAIRQMNAVQAQEEQRRAAERAEGYQPMRFYLPDPTKAGVTPADLQADIIILDQAPDFAVFEHSFPNPRTGRYGKGAFTHLCLSQEGHCPACDADEKDPYFALFLSVIDMRPYTIQDGDRAGQVIPFKKKILAVKNKNQDYFFRQYEREGTLRGMHLLMVRNDKRGANHGTPEFVSMHTEEEIFAAFGGPAVLYTRGERAGQIAKPENDDCYPFDYAQVFPKPDYNAMLQRFGGQPAAGSGADFQRTFGADAGQINGIAPRGTPGGIAAQRRQAPPTQMQSYGEPEGGMDDEIPFDGGQQDDGDYSGVQRYVGAEQSPVGQDEQEQQASVASAPSIRGRGPRPGGAVTDPADIPL